MENNNYTEYGYRGVEEVKNLKLENSILKENVKDLQEQLQNAYKRNKELVEQLDCETLVPMAANKAGIH
jgi:predicted nuclease with TOPRIM domain